MDIEEWARNNKKAIAREFIRNTNFDSSTTPTGIFTAGLPGAGKTEFTVNLLRDIANNPVRIDMDEIATNIEGYRPKIADKFRAGASIILAKIYDEVIKHKLDFVFDGTFAHDNALRNLDRALEHGYKVKVYFIHQSPEKAWAFTQDRELIEHRAITREGFIEAYTNLQKNLEALCKVYKNVTISLIVKDEQNKVGQRIEDVPDLLTSLKFLTEEELRTVIV